MELINSESEAEYGTLLQYFILHLPQDHDAVPVSAFPQVWQLNSSSISFMSNDAKEQGITWENPVQSRHGSQKRDLRLQRAETWSSIQLVLGHRWISGSWHREPLVYAHHGTGNNWEAWSPIATDTGDQKQRRSLVLCGPQRCSAVFECTGSRHSRHLLWRLFWFHPGKANWKLVGRPHQSQADNSVRRFQCREEARQKRGYMAKEK